MLHNLFLLCVCFLLHFLLFCLWIHLFSFSFCFLGPLFPVTCLMWELEFTCTTLPFADAHSHTHTHTRTHTHRQTDDSTGWSFFFFLISTGGCSVITTDVCVCVCVWVSVHRLQCVDVWLLSWLQRNWLCQKENYFLITASPFTCLVCVYVATSTHIHLASTLYLRTPKWRHLEMLLSLKSQGLHWRLNRQKLRLLGTTIQT